MKNKLHNPNITEDGDSIQEFYYGKWNRNLDEMRAKYYESVDLIINGQLLDDVPDDGLIAEIGTNRCINFLKLCEKFGKNRCIGFDLNNPLNLDNIIVGDVREILPNKIIDLAFIFNDLGGWTTTPECRQITYKWAKQNIINGGYLLEQGNVFSGWNIEKDLQENGFDIMFTNDFITLSKKL